MITIKDFSKGEKVYVLCLHSGRNVEPTIGESIVKIVGKKYVTLDDFGNSKYQNWNADFLHEKVDWGESSLLFKTRTAAEEYIEKQNLAIWLGLISTGKAEKYSLEQLRKVKEILG